MNASTIRFGRATTASASHSPIHIACFAADVSVNRRSAYAHVADIAVAARVATSYTRTNDSVNAITLPRPMTRIQSGRGRWRLRALNTCRSVSVAMTNAHAL